MVSSHRLRVVCLTLANLLLPLAVLVFAAGFFPYKPVLPGLADWDDGSDAGIRNGPEAHAPFNKVIFMVVDALRSDFVFGEDSAMGFIQTSVSI
jgi:ethanolaminephosphotransferase